MSSLTDKCKYLEEIIHTIDNYKRACFIEDETVTEEVYKETERKYYFQHTSIYIKYSDIDKCIEYLQGIYDYILKFQLLDETMDFGIKGNTAGTIEVFLYNTSLDTLVITEKLRNLKISTYVRRVTLDVHKVEGYEIWDSTLDTLADYYNSYGHIILNATMIDKLMHQIYQINQNKYPDCKSDNYKKMILKLYNHRYEIIIDVFKQYIDMETFDNNEEKQWLQKCLKTMTECHIECTVSPLLLSNKFTDDELKIVDESRKKICEYYNKRTKILKNSIINTKLDNKR